MPSSDSDMHLLRLSVCKCGIVGRIVVNVESDKLSQHSKERHVNLLSPHSEAHNTSSGKLVLSKLTSDKPVQRVLSSDKIAKDLSTRKVNTNGLRSDRKAMFVRIPLHSCEA